MTDAGFWVEPEALADLPAVLSSFDRPWWIAGGWAIDLAAGRVTRDHDDVEIAVLFEDQHGLRAALAGWDLRVADAGRLHTWPADETVALPRHQLWCRRSPEAAWSLEVLFEATDGDDWVFRRDRRIRRPLATFGTLSPEARVWLREALDVVDPGHPWARRL